MKKYYNLIPIGYSCDVALELECMGLRTKSYPFDWIISDLQSFLILLSNNFEDFINVNFLYKNNKYLSKTYVVSHKKYNIEFYHDFYREKSISEQINSVYAKYYRRINRLYEDIKLPSLFIHYIKDIDDYYFIKKNYKKIDNFIKSYNRLNKIIFISNDNSFTFKKKIIIFYVKNKNDKYKEKKWLRNNKIIYKYLLNNLNISKKIHLYSLIRGTHKRIKRFIKIKISKMVIII